MYRSSTNVPLGLLEPTKHVPEGIAPRWYLSNAPQGWGEDDAKSWISERGFTETSMLRRQGRKNWYFRGHAPVGTSTVQQAFVFKSGISTALASNMKSAKTATTTADKQAHSVWGAPEPPKPKPEKLHTTEEAEASQTETKTPH